jgi:hypothetical protein
MWREHLQQAEHAGTKGNGSSGDDAFTHTAHVIASAADKSKRNDCSFHAGMRFTNTATGRS